VEVGVVNAHIVFGLFALYVAAISLWLVLAGQQDTLLALLRQFWGRTVGHALYFVVRVALPVLICVICLSWGVRQYDATIAFHNSDPPLQLNIEYYRDLRLMLLMDKSPDPVEVIYGA
jgi:hypothetical protein